MLAQRISINCALVEVSLGVGYSRSFTPWIVGFRLLRAGLCGRISTTQLLRKSGLFAQRAVVERDPHVCIASGNENEAPVIA